MSACVMMTSSSVKGANGVTARASPLVKSTFTNRSAFTAATTKAIKPVSRAVRVTPMALFGSKAAPASIYDVTVEDIDGKKVPMNTFKGKVLLVLNVASNCGFTPQYKELVQLYSKYNKDGLEIIGQPCNQFGGQEPGSNAEIKAFAGRQGAKFSMLSKADVNGQNEAPLWTFLKSKQGGMLSSDIKWNFSKFLVDREGNVVQRYSSMVPPLSIEQDIQALL